MNGAASAVSTMPLANIRIGQRHRRDMGDIAGLAASICEDGLLHPAVVTSDGTLVAGQRRIEAFRLLGRSEIPVTVVDLERVVRGEYAENTFRKAFTPSEMADIADALEPLERAKAKERQGTRTDQHPANFATSSGRALDNIGKIVGAHRDTIAKAREVRDAARAEPERFGKLAADMDRTGRVNGPFKRLTVSRQAAAIRAEPPPFPSRGPYRVIVVDVPWPYDPYTSDPRNRATYPYPQISIEAACAMGPQVREIAHDDCTLWFWTNNFHLLNGNAYAVLDAWGFQRKALLTWDKEGIGRGEWLRSQSEHCIMAVCGKPAIELKNQSTILRAPVPRDAAGKIIHSAKPEKFYELVESLCPAPRYAELFARRTREGWDSHGDEVGRDAAL